MGLPAYDAAMGLARLVPASLGGLFGGWLVLLSYALVQEIEYHADSPARYLPLHPIARVVIYVAVATGVQVVAAWRLMPDPAQRNTDTVGYGGRLAFCLTGSVGAALAIVLVASSLRFLFFCGSDCT